MEVKTPADIDDNMQILDVFANEGPYPYVKYCVFEIDGVVRVVKNIQQVYGKQPAVHAEVEVINILKENMGEILERNKRITLYMNHPPCSTEGHKCAAKIVQYNKMVSKYNKYFFDFKVNRRLKLRIIFADFPVLKGKVAKKAEYGIYNLSKSVQLETLDTASRWKNLKALLTKWYEKGGVDAPEKIKTDKDVYHEDCYPYRKDIDKEQVDHLNIAIESASQSDNE